MKKKQLDKREVLTRGRQINHYITEIKKDNSHLNFVSISCICILISLCLLVIIILLRIFIPGWVMVKEYSHHSIVVHNSIYFMGIIPFLSIISILLYLKSKGKIMISGIIGLIITSITFLLWMICLIYLNTDTKDHGIDLFIGVLFQVSFFFTILYNIYLLGVHHSERKSTINDIIEFKMENPDIKWLQLSYTCVIFSFFIVVFLIVLTYLFPILKQRDDQLYSHLSLFIFGWIPILTIISIFSFSKFKGNEFDFGIIGIFISGVTLIFWLVSIFIFFVLIKKSGWGWPVPVCLSVLFLAFLTICFNMYMFAILQRERKN